MAQALTKIGDKRIKMVGIDHDEVVLKAVKDGFVDGTMLQNPYGQGYIGSYVLDKLRSGCTLKEDAPWKSNALTAKFVKLWRGRLDAKQIDTYVDAMRSITKTVLANFESNYLASVICFSSSLLQRRRLSRMTAAAASSMINFEEKHKSALYQSCHGK